MSAKPQDKNDEDERRKKIIDDYRITLNSTQANVILQSIHVCSKRGAFQPSEFSALGSVYDYIQSDLQKYFQQNNLLPEKEQEDPKEST